MTQRKIVVAMGEGAVGRVPHIISSLGLGSCVAVTLYDTRCRIGGLAHIMLPDSASLSAPCPPYHCADTAIAALLKELRSRGALRRDIVVKMAGGAGMFVSSNGLSPGIGAQNTTAVKYILEKNGIVLVGEDTGGHHGRSVEFHLDSGSVTVKAIGKIDREL